MLIFETDALLLYSGWFMKLKLHVTLMGARCSSRSWLRHCATSRKVTGLIPSGVTEIFH